MDKPVSKAGDADIHDAQDAQAAPFLVLEECPNTGNVPIAESSQTLQMNEANPDAPEHSKRVQVA